MLVSVGWRVLERVVDGGGGLALALRIGFDVLVDVDVERAVAAGLANLLLEVGGALLRVCSGLGWDDGVGLRGWVER